MGKENCKKPPLRFCLFYRCSLAFRDKTGKESSTFSKRFSENERVHLQITEATNSDNQLRVIKCVVTNHFVSGISFVGQKGYLFILGALSLNLDSMGEDMKIYICHTVVLLLILNRQMVHIQINQRI